MGSAFLGDVKSHVKRDKDPITLDQGCSNKDEQLQVILKPKGEHWGYLPSQFKYLSEANYYQH